MAAFGLTPAPGPAAPLMLQAAPCGPAATDFRAPIPIPRKSDGRDRRCPVACHAAGVARRRDNAPDDADAPA